MHGNLVELVESVLLARHRRGIQDVLAVRIPAQHAVRRAVMRDPPRQAAQGRNHVNVGIAVVIAAESDQRAVRRKPGEQLLPARRTQPRGDASGLGRDPDITGVNKCDLCRGNVGVTHHARIDARRSKRGIVCAGQGAGGKKSEDGGRGGQPDFYGHESRCVRPCLSNGDRFAKANAQSTRRVPIRYSFDGKIPVPSARVRGYKETVMSRLNLWLAAASLLLAPVWLAAQPLRVLDDKLYYLGTPGDPEWQEFAGRTPHGRRLDLKFTTQANTNENTLFIRQRDVKLDWGIELNGRKLGKLFLSEQDLIQALPLPAGALHDGENTISITPPNARDDIEVGEIRLDSRPPSQALNESTLNITVTDEDTQQPLPCRLTVADRNGSLFPFHVDNGQSPNPGHPRSTNRPPSFLPLRPGVVYSGTGAVRIGLPAGYYTLYASRGLEYSVRTQRLTLPPGRTYPLPLRIRDRA